MPICKKLKAIDVLFSFLLYVHQKGYVAVDFYDGSIMYDFHADETTICDIDFFRKAPVLNDKGCEWFGTKRLKAPEEYIEDSVIDEQTNIFTLGALIFEFFGSFSDEEIQYRYDHDQFMPCALQNWHLDEKSYRVASKAVRPNRTERYPTLAEFFKEWKSSTETGRAKRRILLYPAAVMQAKSRQTILPGLKSHCEATPFGGASFIFT